MNACFIFIVVGVSVPLTVIWYSYQLTLLKSNADPSVLRALPDEVGVAVTDCVPEEAAGVAVTLGELVDVHPARDTAAITTRISKIPIYR
jgi:hypothetical protein